MKESSVSNFDDQGKSDPGNCSGNKCEVSVSNLTYRHISHHSSTPNCSADFLMAGWRASEAGKTVHKRQGN